MSEWIQVFSDVHANYPALASILRAVDDGQVIGQWFLGDLMGYGPDIEKVVHWFLKASEQDSDLWLWVPGNHDIAAIQPQRWQASMNKLARAALEYHIQWLKEAGLWKGLEQYIELQGQAFLTASLEDIVHGLPLYQTGHTVWLLSHGALFPAEARVGWYLFPWAPELRDQMRMLEDWRRRQGWRRVVLLVGHTHFPLAVWRYGESIQLRDISYSEEMELEEGSWLLNPGSVGQPRDGDRRAAFLLVNPEIARVRFQRVNYDWRETLQEIWNRYPPSIADRLGRWIEMDGSGDKNIQRFLEFYSINLHGLHARTENVGL